MSIPWGISESPAAAPEGPAPAAAFPLPEPLLAMAARIFSDTPAFLSLTSSSGFNE